MCVYNFVVVFVVFILYSCSDALLIVCPHLSECILFKILYALIMCQLLQENLFLLIDSQSVVLCVAFFLSLRVC